MPNDKPATARKYDGVMVSSTFTDLREHRKALMDALRKQELFAIGMEDYVTGPDDTVISSSLDMVRKGSAYIGLISRRCGQIPKCAERNPHDYSICRLEFEEAQNLNRPTLVFIMGDDHLVKSSHVEIDAEKIKKLEAYRSRAKEGRIYVVFESLEDFTKQAIHAVANLRRYLDELAEAAVPEPDTAADKPGPDKTEADAIPAPPAFYAEPRYIGSHEFVGRAPQLDTLNDWASPADAHPILLFEAIGGAGKSMLTWQWTRNDATTVRKDWAGLFWYSFYEKGAVMADFCGRALAYMTRRPFEEFKKKKTLELGELLLNQLQEKPWLLILDGLERVLVAYQRFDAAQLRDEEADTPTDQIADRDPCTAIRPEDDDLLRTLAAAAPSKLLLTTRLTPRILLNKASQPIPGVLRERLPGLRPADAEALLRSCGVTGDSAAIQHYLKTHCDCHPLVTGVLAGLINDYLPDRGDFDAWSTDADGGGRLNLADLDLTQKRNHILTAALEALDDKGRQLLSTLALLSEAVDYATLSAFNPHLPPELEEFPEPVKPKDRFDSPWMSHEQKEQAEKEYAAAARQREECLQGLRDRAQSTEFRTSHRRLAETVRELERRGLLQYDGQAKRHDLHPVVRSVVSGRLRKAETEQLGQRVVDHFSQKAHSPYDQAETLADVADGLHVVRTLLQMGRHQQAFDAYHGELSNALVFNLEADAEVLSLLRPFYPQGWAAEPGELDAHSGSHLANYVGASFYATGALEEAVAALTASLQTNLREPGWHGVQAVVQNISTALAPGNQLARMTRCAVLALDLATQRPDLQDLFTARLTCFVKFTKLGRWADAGAMWQVLDPMGRDWQRNACRPGEAEHAYSVFLFEQGLLTEEPVAKAERLAEIGKYRKITRRLHSLRGEWQLEQGQYGPAAESLHEAVRMAREVGKSDGLAEALLAIARFHLKQLPHPHEEAERLAEMRRPFHRGIAELWLAIGDEEQATRHALKAYEWAWADGEPYVRRYELDKARGLLERLGAGIPDLPPYDPAKDEPFPWEADVRAAIEKLREENQAKEARKEAGEQPGD